MKIKLYQIFIVLFALTTISYFFIKMLVFETKEEVFKILAETEYLMIDGDWKENIDTRYEYDEDGDKSSMVVLKYSNGNWTNEYKVNYIYDKTKSLIGELYQNWKGNQWSDSMKIEYINKNNETGTITFDLKSGKQIPVEKYSIKIDTSNKRKEETKFIYENYEWKPIEITTTILNVDLNPIEKTIKKIVNNTWTNSKRYIYQYNFYGLENIEEIYTWGDSTWLFFEKFINEYDTSNVQTSRLWQKWDGKEWVNGWICYYYYDDRGNLTTLIYNIWKNSTWVPDERYKYTYNNEDIGTAHYIDRWKDSKWVDSLKNIYTFGKFTIKKKAQETEISN